MDFLIDTSFLIGLWRDGQKGREYQFIKQHQESTARIPWVVKGEFLRGSAAAGHDPKEVMGFLNRYPVIWPDDQTLEIYAQTWCLLRRSNQMIGVHDLWIAAAALQYKLPVLTRNVAEFARVPDLTVADYIPSRLKKL